MNIINIVKIAPWKSKERESRKGRETRGKMRQGSTGWEEKLTLNLHIQFMGQTRRKNINSAFANMLSTYQLTGQDSWIIARENTRQQTKPHSSASQETHDKVKESAK